MTSDLHTCGTGGPLGILKILHSVFFYCGRTLTILNVQLGSVQSIHTAA